MGCGMFLSAGAFALSGIVQGMIDSSDESTINVMWQVPQLIIISVAEILVSVTGLEFFYSEAPTALKSTMTSMFLLTSAVGNLFTGLIYQLFSGGLTQSGLYLAFAALMVVNSIVFVIAASFYQYRKDRTEGLQSLMRESSMLGDDEDGESAWLEHVSTAPKDPGPRGDDGGGSGANDYQMESGGVGVSAVETDLSDSRGLSL